MERNHQNRILDQFTRQAAPFAAAAAIRNEEALQGIVRMAHAGSRPDARRRQGRARWHRAKGPKWQRQEGPRRHGLMAAMVSAEQQ
jgi:hypothetical protein